jgi:hypothetical protein
MSANSRNDSSKDKNPHKSGDGHFTFPVFV